MRLVENVDVAVAIKTYPDGRLTAKLRSNIPVSSTISGYFGGGGHEYAAGFRVYESIDTIIPELVDSADKAIKDYQNVS
jgi:nanoRNase/pAp phosphatase (c-di-AMP/oligoRNAs hydrolase)